MLERIPKDNSDTSQDAFDFRHPPFTHTHTRGNLETSISLMCRVLNWGRKPE